MRNNYIHFPKQIVERIYSFALVQISLLSDLLEDTWILLFGFYLL